MEDHILDNRSDGGVEELHRTHAEPSVMASITVWPGIGPVLQKVSARKPGGPVWVTVYCFLHRSLILLDLGPE